MARKVPVYICLDIDDEWEFFCDGMDTYSGHWWPTDWDEDNHVPMMEAKRTFLKEMEKRLRWFDVPHFANGRSDREKRLSEIIESAENE